MKNTGRVCFNVVENMLKLWTAIPWNPHPKSKMNLWRPSFLVFFAGGWQRVLSPIPLVIQGCCWVGMAWLHMRCAEASLKDAGCYGVMSPAFWLLSTLISGFSWHSFIASGGFWMSVDLLLIVPVVAGFLWHTFVFICLMMVVIASMLILSVHDARMSNTSL